MAIGRNLTSNIRSHYPRRPLPKVDDTKVFITVAHENCSFRRLMPHFCASTQKSLFGDGFKSGAFYFDIMTNHRQLGEWFANAATGFAVTDLRGNIINANPTLARIVDLTPGQISDANLFELTHPEDQSRHRGLLEKLLASEIPAFVIEKRYVRPDGSVVWVR